MSLHNITITESNWDLIWQGMPSYQSNEIKEYKSLFINIKTEEDLQKLNKLLNLDLSSKSVSTFYPEKESLDIRPIRFFDEEDSRINLDKS